MSRKVFQSGKINGWNLLLVRVCLQDIHSQGEVIACLEKGLVREAEGQLGAHPIKDDCKKAIMRVAELSSDDFHLDRYLFFACRDDRERFCENVSTLYLLLFFSFIFLPLNEVFFFLQLEYNPS